MERKRKIWFALFHAVLLAGIALFPVYRRLTSRLSFLFGGCILHDRFFLYCPLCGGTRAVAALLRFDFLSALRYNGYVVVVALLALIAYLVAWVRLIRGKGREPLLRVRGWMWITLAASLAVWFVARNLLMILCGFDPTGDLGIIWNTIL